MAIYWDERPETGAKSPFKGVGEATREEDGVAFCTTKLVSSVEGERTGNSDACAQDGRGCCIANPAAVVETVTGLVAVSPIIGASLAT